MPVSASLSSARVEVAPGGTATVELTVRNTGSVVDEFRIEILGEGAAFTMATPAILPLFPGASAPVTITFNPPRRSDRSAGEIDVAVKVVSREDADGSAVEELVLAIGGFDAPDAELVPRTIRASRKANVQVAIDNLGNRRMQRSIAATDADQKLKFETVPAGVVVEAGRAEFAKVTIKPVKTFFRGPDRTIPYRVTLGEGGSEGEGEGTIALDGTFVQTAMLPKWLLRLLMFLLGLLLALAAMWQFAFKPVIKSAARAAAEAQVDKAVEKASENAAVQTAKAIKAAETPGAGAAGGPDPATAAAAEAAAKDAAKKAVAKSAGGDGASGSAASAASGDDGKGGLAKSKRISVEAAPGATASVEWKPGGDNDRFSITDVVLQNAQGDTGKIRLKRGDEILLESALENFRDLDFHVIAPFIVQGRPVVIEVVCNNSAEVGPCKPAATVGGFLLAGAPTSGAVTTTTKPSS
jgi:hypothetical protein